MIVLPFESHPVKGGLSGSGSRKWGASGFRVGEAVVDRGAPRAVFTTENTVSDLRFGRCPRRTEVPLFFFIVLVLWASA